MTTCPILYYGVFGGDGVSHKNIYTFYSTGVGLIGVEKLRRRSGWIRWMGRETELVRDGPRPWSTFGLQEILMVSAAYIVGASTSVGVIKMTVGSRCRVVAPGIPNGVRCHPLLDAKII